MASPLSKPSWDSLTSVHLSRQNDKMREAEMKFENAPSDASFLEMTATYGEFYFSEARAKDGVKWLARDQVSHQLFLRCTSGGIKDEAWLEKVRAYSLPKLFIAGKSDTMFPTPLLKQDAKSGGFDFKTVSTAGHFVTYEQPAQVIELIEQFVRSL